MLSYFAPWMDVGFLLSWDGRSGGEILSEILSMCT